MTQKIWANSGDSHFLEPETLWRDTLPPRLAELVPYTERDPDGQWETIHIDGMSFRRQLPTGKKKEFFEASMRAPGAPSMIFAPPGPALQRWLGMVVGGTTFLCPARSGPARSALGWSPCP